MSLYQSFVNNQKPFLIAGPCVIESKDNIFKIAEYLKKLTDKLGITYVFKASYLKANRTSIESYSGPGIDEGLKILDAVKKDFNLPILTDIHEVDEVDQVAEVADILQIPAFLSRQTFLLKAAAETDKIINIKKAQFMAPEDLIPAAKKVKDSGNNKIMLTERGASFGYHNLVVDFRGFPIMEKIGYPVIYDVTHSLQRPSIGKSSGGNPEFVPKMAAAAIATGSVNGLFLETHPDPSKALSDAASMIKLDKVEKILEQCIRIYELVRGF